MIRIENQQLNIDVSVWKSIYLFAMNWKAAFIFRFFLMVFIPVTASAAVRYTGVPAIRNFPRQTYRAATQNWAVAKDHRGIMYFANNDGLLEYDGTYWNLHQFAMPAITRSVATDEKGNLYVGMYNDFGSVKPDASGKLAYSSFRRALPDTLKDIGEVWRIHITPEGIFFQTYYHLMLFSKTGQLLEIHNSEGSFRFSFYVNEKLYVQDVGVGLHEYNQNKLIVLPGFEVLADREIWAMHSGSFGNLIIGTSDNGIYNYRNGTLTPWDTYANQLLINNQIFSSISLGDQRLAFGTIQGGLIITSETGQLLQTINKGNGLYNNTILSMATDNFGNIWLGLDNGINYVEINSPLTYLHYPDGFGVGYTAAIHNEKLYIGTNNGLFTAPWPENPGVRPMEFTLIPGSVGQVWYLGVHGNVLLCGHDNGSFQVDGLTMRRLSDQKGAWKFIELSNYPGYLVGGTYQGLTLYQMNQATGNWQFVRKLSGFSESSRVMEIDKEGSIWMTHGFKGVFRIAVSPYSDSIQSVDFYDTAHGFSTNNFINVYKIDGDPVFTAPDGIFRYISNANRFERDTLFEGLFPAGHISYLKQDLDRNIWFVADNRPGVLRYLENGNFSLVTETFEPIFNHMLGGFEFILPHSSSHVFIAIENGFAHYSPRIAKPGTGDFATYIRTIEWLNMDSVLYGGNAYLNSADSRRKVLEVPFRRNAVRFTFSVPRYHGAEALQYRYKLSNYLGDWSAWTASTTCEFSNLREGTYHFTVQARDPLNRISSSDEFTFEILPPWHRSSFAYASYLILFVILILFVTWFILKRIEISKRKERLGQLRIYRAREQAYQRDALIAEKEIINLRNEQLRSTMIHRDKELANQTLNLIEKNKLLTKIKDELRRLNLQIKDEMLKIKISQLVRYIDKDIDNEKQWEVFELAFDDVHEDFMKRMKERYPELTPRELRLCAYLKMDLSTKEIAALLNISVRGVEISRYRLRKKIAIDRDTNLAGFIVDL
jgi:ligand-binding sensor domain-containing protein/DNA-binding CsgD family transcriptional regulator